MQAPAVRAATDRDIPAIQGLIHELAEFENLGDQVHSTETDLREALFGTNPCAEAIVVDVDFETVAYALFFTTYSTFVGRPGLYLEDVYVKPQHRGMQIGTQMIKHLAAISRQRNYGRMEWTVLDWNQRAIDFYEKHGAEILHEWRIVRTQAPGIEKLTRDEA